MIARITESSEKFCFAVKIIDSWPAAACEISESIAVFNRKDAISYKTGYIAYALGKDMFLCPFKQTVRAIPSGHINILFKLFKRKCKSFRTEVSKLAITGC